MTQIHPVPHTGRTARAGTLATLLVAAGLLGSCGYNQPEQIEATTRVTTTQTVVSTTTETETTTQVPAAPPADTPPQVAPPPVEVPAPGDPGNTPAPRGYTGAPGTEPIRELDKQIAGCGDPAIHERGTTFFTDGTSGWTEQCAAAMG